MSRPARGRKAREVWLHTAGSSGTWHACMIAWKGEPNEKVCRGARRPFREILRPRRKKRGKP